MKKIHYLRSLLCTCLITGGIFILCSHTANRSNKQEHAGTGKPVQSSSATIWEFNDDY